MIGRRTALPLLLALGAAVALLAPTPASAQDPACVYINPGPYCPVDETLGPIADGVAAPLAQDAVRIVERSGCVYINPGPWCPADDARSTLDSAGQQRRGGGGPPAFVYEATGCVESIVSIPVDTASLRPFIPERFEIFERAPGKSLIQTGIPECEGISVNGSVPKPGIFNDAGVRIHSPDGSDGAHFYLLWQVQDLPALHAKMRSVGMDGGLDRDATHTTVPLGPLTTAAGSIHWPGAPHSMEVTTGPYVPDADGGNFWWHLGPQGLIRVSYEFTNMFVGFGAGTVETEAGTPLAAMLGAEAADGLGVSVLLDFRGVVEVVERPARPASTHGGG